MFGTCLTVSLYCYMKQVFFAKIFRLVKIYLLLFYSANIFMYYIENPFLYSFNLQPTAYFKYIHNIFLIWSHGIDTLEIFIENANRTHRYISFTHEYSKIAVSFLDVVIKISKGTISTCLYKKEH